MAELFGGDAGDEVVEGLQFLFLFEAKGLVEVVVQRGHFAELAAEKLLNGSGAVRIRVGGLL